MLMGLAVIAINIGIHIGIKAEVVGIGFVPCGHWLPVGEADLYDSLRALETVLPWHDQAERRAVLVR